MELIFLSHLKTRFKFHSQTFHSHLFTRINPRICCHKCSHLTILEHLSVNIQSHKQYSPNHSMIFTADCRLCFAWGG